MDNEFWHDRWQRGDIGFHRESVHDLLTESWPKLAIGVGSDVFVPLCGKSLDMVWLAEKGYRIVGCELSELAIDSFFQERGLSPESTIQPGFTVKRAGPYVLWRGDIFNMQAAAIANATAVYDRAALVAFPAQQQPAYAKVLKELVPLKAPVLLISLSFDQEEMTGPPYPAPDQQIETLFGEAFEIRKICGRDALAANPGLAKRGLTALQESAFVLTRRRRNRAVERQR